MITKKFEVLLIICFVISAYGKGQNNAISSNEFNDLHHKVYVNRQLWKTQQYLSIYKDSFLKSDSVNYPILYPKYSEHERIIFNRLDSLSSLYEFEFYEFYFKERCDSSNDEEFNREALKLHEEFNSTSIIPCSCCLRLGGTINDGKIFHIPDCKYEPGVIGFLKNQPNSTRVYFISGTCVFLDDFESVFYERHGVSDSTVRFMKHLLTWKKNEIDSKVLEYKKH